MSDEVFVENNNITWEVRTKAAWVDPWNLQPALMPTSVKFALSPDTNTATLIINRGLTKILSDPLEFVQLADDIIGHYIQIRLSYINVVDPDRIIYWTGVVPSPVDNIDGSFPDVENPPDIIAQGLTTYNCYGLEWFMLKTKVSFVYKDLDVPVKRMIPFNYGNKSRNNVLAGNRSTAPSVGLGIFTFSDDGELWTAKNVLDHLVELFNNDVFAGSAFNLTIIDNFAYQDLDNVENSWSFEHTSYLDAINQVVNPAYGFSWQIRTDVTGVFVQLQVVSVVDVDITEGVSTILRKNETVISNVDLSGNGFIEEATVVNLENNHYDKIIVQGERLRCSFTMEIDETGADVQKMRPQWDNESAYEAATDKERTQEEFEAVFQRFVFHPDFNGKEAAGKVILPSIDVATGQPTTITAAPGVVQELFLKGLMLDRNLPQGGLETVDGKAQRRPFVLFTDGAGIYYRADKTGDTLFTNAGLRMLDDAAGIQMDQQVNHLNALNFFVGDSDFDVQYDYATSLITISMYTDERVRVEVVALEASPFEVARVLRIDAPGLHVWHVAENTIKSFDDTTLSRYVAAELVRDDSAQLLRIASLANAWYGRKRSTINITYGDPFVLDVVGAMLESADTGGVAVTVGTVISMVEFKLEEKSQSVDLETSFKDFNFNKVLGLNKSFESLNTTGQASMDELQNINVRSAPGGAGGTSAYTGPFAVIYDSATDQFKVGNLRNAGNGISDIVTSGLDDIELVSLEFIARGANTNGYIYYELTGIAPSPFFTITLKISNGGTVPAQSPSTKVTLLARYKHDGSAITLLRQLKYGNITSDGRW